MLLIKKDETRINRENLFNNIKHNKVEKGANKPDTPDQHNCGCTKFNIPFWLTIPMSSVASNRLFNSHILSPTEHKTLY